MCTSLKASASGSAGSLLACRGGGRWPSCMQAAFCGPSGTCQGAAVVNCLRLLNLDWCRQSGCALSASTCRSGALPENPLCIFNQDLCVGQALQCCSPATCQAGDCRDARREDLVAKPTPHHGSHYLCGNGGGRTHWRPVCTASFCLASNASLTPAVLAMRCAWKPDSNLCQVVQGQLEALPGHSPPLLQLQAVHPCSTSGIGSLLRLLSQHEQGSSPEHLSLQGPWMCVGTIQTGGTCTLHALTLCSLRLLTFGAGTC